MVWAQRQRRPVARDRLIMATKGGERGAEGGVGIGRRRLGDSGPLEQLPCQFELAGPRTYPAHPKQAIEVIHLDRKDESIKLLGIAELALILQAGSEAIRVLDINGRLGI